MARMGRLMFGGILGGLLALWAQACAPPVVRYVVVAPPPEPEKEPPRWETLGPAPESWTAPGPLVVFVPLAPPPVRQEVNVFLPERPCRHEAPEPLFPPFTFALDGEEHRAFFHRPSPASVVVPLPTARLFRRSP